MMSTPITNNVKHYMGGGGRKENGYFYLLWMKQMICERIKMEILPICAKPFEFLSYSHVLEKKIENLNQLQLATCKNPNSFYLQYFHQHFREIERERVKRKLLLNNHNREIKTNSTNRKLVSAVCAENSLLNSFLLLSSTTLNGIRAPTAVAT